MAEILVVSAATVVQSTNSLLLTLPVAFDVFHTVPPIAASSDADAKMISACWTASSTQLATIVFPAVRLSECCCARQVDRLYKYIGGAKISLLRVMLELVARLMLPKPIQAMRGRSPWPGMDLRLPADMAYVAVVDQ